MAYEAEMREIARRARSRWGALREVIFVTPNKNSLLVFSKVVIPAQRLPETDMLAFGYYGTGSECYATFLAEFGFSQTSVDKVSTPSKLTADGKWTRGQRKFAQWTVQVEGQTLDEARGKLQPIDPRTTCMIREEILCDGSQAALTEVVQATNDADAVAILRKDRIPPGSTVVSSTVQEKTTESTEEILAETEQQASNLAQGRIKSGEAPYTALVEVSCLREPRKGFVGLGKRPGTFLAKYSTANREVHLVYSPLARVRVTYGPTKLTCNQCGRVMVTTTEGVHHASSRPSSDSEILKLRCDACDITRFEKRWEIEGDWIEWEDASPPTIV
jgi:hypothetical protein